MKEQTTPQIQYTIICELWERHTVNWWKFECNCLEKMWIDKILIHPCLSLLWYNIFYAKDITKEMRQELYMAIRKDKDFFKKAIQVMIKWRIETIKDKRKKDESYFRWFIEKNFLKYN